MNLLARPGQFLPPPSRAETMKSVGNTQLSARRPDSAISPGATTRSRYCSRCARSPAALALLAYTIFTLALTLRVWMSAANTIIGLLGDPEQYIWLLAWGPFAVSHHLNPFYTTYLIAPVGANLAWVIPAGPALLMWPITSL